MQQQSQFSIQLRKYIKMLITIWPSLRPGLRHISDITGPQQHSLLPPKSYSTMSQQMFLQTIINDLHLYIMQHDVKQFDIQDYLYDILDLLHIDEQVTASNSNIGGIRYMSQQLIQVISQLQQGKTEKVEKFEKIIYNPVIQMGVGQAIQQGGDSDSEQEGSGDDQQQMDEQDMEQNDEQWQEQQEQQRMKQQNQQKQQQQKKQKQLQDDGWVIVKKKK